MSNTTLHIGESLSIQEFGPACAGQKVLTLPARTATDGHKTLYLGSLSAFLNDVNRDVHGLGGNECLLRLGDSKGPIRREHAQHKWTQGGQKILTIVVESFDERERIRFSRCHGPSNC